MRSASAFIAATLALAIAFPATALAWREYSATWEGDPYDCEACHTDPFPFDTTHTGSGPHSGYSVTSDKCAACHFVHDAPLAGAKLLRQATIVDNCNVCHDGTGGSGVYGTLAARGVVAGATHSIDATNVIPGGSETTGGDRTQAFGGTDGMLSCDDCHSPHNASTVDPYRGERVRFHVTEAANFRLTLTSSRLLKRQPTGAVAETAKYGSDWCASCHRGRPSGLAMVANHPVDMLAANPSAFHVDRVSIVTSETALTTEYGPLGFLGSGDAGGSWHNRGYVMPEPRTAEQTGHAPICQQCHEDTRDVGSAGAVVPAVITRYGDGLDPADNPRFQCFPHETENPKMLVESDDDLCTNCHISELP